MNFEKQKALEVLKNTPKVMYALLSTLSEDWYNAREGKGSWSPKEVIAHLILGEKTDWIPRAQLILSNVKDKTFTPFDMKSHLSYVTTKTITELLDEFTTLRQNNIVIFEAFDLTDENLNKTGIHSSFGEVTLKQHLSTWVTHDLGHISQISRVMAKQYKTEVGPWTAYISILN